MRPLRHTSPSTPCSGATRQPRRAYSTYYSDVELSDDAIVGSPPSPAVDGPFRLVTVGAFDQLYKAPDVLIDAVAACVRAGSDVTLTLVGDGLTGPSWGRADCHGSASACGTGDLPLGRRRARPARFGAPLLAAVAPAGPSARAGRGDGAGTAVRRLDGRRHSELLPADNLVPPSDVEALATKIREVLEDPERRARMSAANLATARGDRESELHDRRVALYREVRRRTEAALGRVTRSSYPDRLSAWASPAARPCRREPEVQPDVVVGGDRLR